MLKNDYLLAKIGVDTAENEPRKEWCVVGFKYIILSQPMASEVIGVMCQAAIQLQSDDIKQAEERVP